MSDRKDHDFGADCFRRHRARHLHAAPPRTTTSSMQMLDRGDDDLNPRNSSWLTPGDSYREAAVLVPLIDRGAELQVLLTQRTHELPTHAGQIAFPGGKIDDDDAGAVAAALRETHEETGIAPDFVDVLGFLDGYRTGTQFRITPVVAIVEPGFTLVPEPGEVADIFEVPLSFLMDRSNHMTHSMVWRGKQRFYYAMPYGEHYIWGATAGILRNLFERAFDDGAGAAAVREAP